MVTALKLIALAGLPALIGQLNEPLAWLTLFGLTVAFMTAEGKK